MLDSAVGNALTDLSADFSDILLGADPHVGIVEQPRVVTGTLTGATTEKLITRVSESWIATVETDADLSGVVEVLYGLGKESYVGLLDGDGNIVSSRRITAVDVDNGRLTIEGGWANDPDDESSFTVFYNGEMIESRATPASTPTSFRISTQTASSPFPRRS